MRRAPTVWLTGLSAAGKTTICQAVHQELSRSGRNAEILDGDELRKRLSKDLGFSKADRDTHIRRVGSLAESLHRQGIIALVAVISPYRATRDEIRASIGAFVEVYVNAPLAVCEARDPKGLYKRARSGELRSFTGIDDPYEPPLHAEVECRTDLESLDQCVAKVLAAIDRAESPAP